MSDESMRARCRPGKRGPWLVSLLAAGIWAMPALAAAAMYGYTDDDGRFRVVDSLGAVPEDKRSGAKRMGVTSSAEVSSKPAPRPEAPRSDARPAAGGEEVLTFGADGVAATAPSAPAEPVAPEAPTEEVDDDGHNEAWWQRQVVTWANRKAQAQDEVRQLESQKRILTYGRPAEKTRYRRMLREAEEREEEAREMLETGLPRDAKKAGAPSSWLVLPGLGDPDEDGRDR